MPITTTFPLFGSALLLGVMVAASYTFAVSLSAGVTGRARSLQAARFGAYGTVLLIGSAVVCLAYAFVSHDFRLRYVAHYSDRSMPLAYLFTALWGGQDGSLLWWLFLLSLYIAACVKWLGRKYLELQPYVIATLMVVVLFFCVLMAFAADPFSTSVAGARADGEGLNPLLQNYWMIIHPPSLYTGFVGCTVPFAFAVAALVTGRLDHEWIVASRKWTLFAWMFLGIGNTLGMVWAYEELGWGGYWAWDPVENAAFLPFLTASAFVHSCMIQERRGLLKTWNVVLVCLTFFLTIFGTFLTRSGAIASVHSFAQSSIGTYFVYFLVLLVAVVLTLILYRWPELRSYEALGGKTPGQVRKATVLSGWAMLLIAIPAITAVTHLSLGVGTKIVLASAIAGGAVYAGTELIFRRLTQGIALRSLPPRMESVLSREFTFLLNNYALLGFMVFVLVATTFPMISEAFWDEKVTVGPPYYNAWVQPMGLVIFMLMGIGTLLGWKKTSPHLLRRAFRAPIVAGVLMVVLHAAFGHLLGFPALVWGEPIYAGALGQVLRVFNAFTPVIGVGLCAFNTAVIVQEFVMLFRSRSRTKADATPRVLWLAGVLPGLAYTLITLPPPSRRRYGGYIVHFGIVMMFLGFTGKSWTVDREASMHPGETLQVEEYTLEYMGPRMEVDNTKRMVFADLKVTDTKSGKVLGAVTPAKFIYKKMPESPTTEVSMLHSVRDDLYLVVGTVNPETKVASLQVHVNPLVGFIWLGCMILICGSILCMWPQLEPEESRAWSFARGTAAVLASTTLGIVLALMPSPAFGQENASSSLHAGTVHIENEQERDLFSNLRCMCGGCPRDLLSTCACETAAAARESIRRKMQDGQTKDQILLAYSQEYGTESLALPPNRGGMRAIYALPLAIIVAGGFGLVVLVRRWRGKGEPGDGAPPGPGNGSGGPPRAGGAGGATASTTRDEYDARLDAELDDLDG